MRESGSKELSEQQELLLSSYLDNECSFISRLRAERLIKRNETAKLFVQNLKNTSDTYRSLFSESTQSPDLWDKISQRIDAEARAALYLGQRKPPTETHEKPSVAHFFSKQALVGGLSGAAVAACVLLFISRPTKPGEIIPVYTGGPVAAHNPSAFHQASLGSPQQAAVAGSSMEVDWMRSNGSLKIIQNPSNNSAIFWVRKRPSARALGSQGIQATPTIRALHEEGLDVTPLGTAK
jgi:hypothetical protein